mmetsp:Transcript_54733/g.127729  ORF Transcript_54733/g.127729 Transcript_54733/m.127729 type:complete len:110 (-) Transcript_54733:856-1185(-)
MVGRENEPVSFTGFVGRRGVALRARAGPWQVRRGCGLELAALFALLGMRAAAWGPWGRTHVAAFALGFSVWVEALRRAFALLAVRESPLLPLQPVVFFVRLAARCPDSG